MGGIDMRKVLLLVLLSMAISLSAKAQIDRCERVTEVEMLKKDLCPHSMYGCGSVSTSEIGVTFKNRNSFAVTVRYWVEYRGEKVSGEDDVRIEKDYSIDLVIPHWAGDNLNGREWKNEKEYIRVRHQTVKCPQ